PPEAPREFEGAAAGARRLGRWPAPLLAPSERHPPFELLGDVLGHQLGVDLGLADLQDVQVHFAAGHLLEVAAQLFDVGALLADDDARTRGVNRDAGLLGRPLDHDAAHAGLHQALLQILAQAQVLVQQARIALVGEPARIPGAVDADPQPDRIDLLTHLFALLALAHHDGEIAPRLQDAGAAAAGARVEALHDH